MTEPAATPPLRPPSMAVKLTSTGAPMPRIWPLTWSNAREVLPHEAQDFTPWLAENLDLLAETLGLDDLSLVTREWDVESFSLDLLAVGSDATVKFRS